MAPALALLPGRDLQHVGDQLIIPFPLGVSSTSSKLHSSTKKIHKNKDILKTQKYNHPS